MMPGREKPLIIPYFLHHEGCPQRCIFCNQFLIVGSRPSENLAAVVQRYLGFRRPGGRDRVEIAFYGGSFTCLPVTRQRQLLEQAQVFVDRGEVQGLRFSTRPDAVGAAELEVVRPYAVETVELGVQSFDDRVLTFCRRGHGSETAVAAVRRLQRCGYRVGIQLLFGLPGQTQESFRADIVQVVALQPDFVRLYPALVLRRTEWEQYWRRGQYPPLSLEAAVSWAAEAWETLAARGISIIRLGLQSSPALEEPGNVVAGPRHPAFGELVKSRVWREKIIDILRKCVLDKQSRSCQGQRTAVSVGLHQADLSAFVGQRRENLRYFERQYAGLEISWHLDPRLRPGEFFCRFADGSGQSGSLVVKG